VGKNASFIQVPFLNLMATLASRGGEVHVRVGGNTQDYATLVDYLDQGRVIEKLSQDTNNPTATPSLLFTRGLLYMMNNISSLVPVKWYLGQCLFQTHFSSQNFKPRWPRLRRLAQAFRLTIPQTCDCKSPRRARGSSAATYLVFK
jgi:hypothetical protein